MRKLWAVVVACSLTVAGCSDNPSGLAQPAASAPAVASSAASPVPGIGTLTRVKVQAAGALAAAPFDQDRFLNLPAGWTASVYARIEKARFMAVTPSGDLLVSQPATGKVRIVRGGQVAVDGLPDNSTPELRGAYAHVLKNIAVQGETLYVSIASTCNACVEDTVSDPQRASIYTYAAGGTNSGKHMLASGIRNAEGLAFRPDTQELWIVVNNRDNTLVPDDRDVDGDGKSDKGKKMAKFVDDYPAEEFIKVRDGAFYGWPFCNPNSDNGLHDMTFFRDYELNKDGTKADCAKADSINLGLAPHSAPLGLTFAKGKPGAGALVPMHGSWNRTKPAGYKVQFVPWTSTGPGDPVDLVTGFVEPNGKWWGRPVDVALDTDGTILVSDDGSGTILRLTPAG